MALLGKRYVCETCGSMVLCTAPGDGELQCCSTQMHEQAAKPLPSSD